MNKIRDLFDNSESILILTHVDPDGDAVGSSLSLYNMLRNMNYNVSVFIPDAPSTFSFLPGFNEIKTSLYDENYDLVITLDCASLDRVAQENHRFESAKYTLNIDHHLSNTNFANYNYVSGSSPACCEYLYTIYKELGLKLNDSVYECLITGILTDTGGFQYSNVSSFTFDIASEISKHVDISKIYTRVLATKTKAQFELEKIAMSRLDFYSDGKIAYTYITKDDVFSVNASGSAHKGIVNIGKNIDGVYVSIFAREVEDGIDVSLRGSGSVDVSEIAMSFGGGGHHDASGFKVDVEMNLLKENLLRKVIKRIDDNG